MRARRAPPGMRRRAILCCLYFGLVPWWVYEATCHYGGGGVRGWAYHLLHNLGHALRWARGREEPRDIQFERTINAAPTFVLWRWPRALSAFTRSLSSR